MGFIQFANAEHAAAVAEELGLDRPVLDASNRIGEGSDDNFRSTIARNFEASKAAGGKMPTMRELARPS